MKPIQAMLVLAMAMPLGVAAQTPPPFKPGLGDLMTMTVHPRHAKLGLAGLEKNWAYAAYEVHELEEALEHVVKYVPKWRDLNIGQLMEATTKQPIEALEAAIKAGDAAKFDAAYKQLTEGCNACHKSAKLPVIVIKAPDRSAFPNQDFAPVK